MRCIKDHTGNCVGPVEYRWNGAGTRSFAWCEFHQAESIRLYEATAELRSPLPPPWFDPSYAGERWDEDE